MRYHLKLLFAAIALLLLPIIAYAQSLQFGAPVLNYGSHVATKSTTVASSALVAKNSTNSLYSFSVTSGASAGYVMLFNATAAPADGTVTPVYCFPLAANSSLTQSFGGTPVAMNTGTVIVFSTTGCFTKTASATAFIAAQVN